MADHRRQRLRELIASRFDGSRRSFCDAAELSESRLAQLLSTTYRDGGEFGEKAARALEQKLDLPPLYFDQGAVHLIAEQKTSTRKAAGKKPAGAAPVQGVDDEHEDPTVMRVRKVKLRLSAGIVGYAADPEEEDDNPIFFRRRWLESRGYSQDKLIAIQVKGESMEPGLYNGDTVVVNTADTAPKDGEVYAVNYEGEAVIKRLVRDYGFWWLVSDNSDQRRFPRKQCEGEACIIIGRVIHKQSERI